MEKYEAMKTNFKDIFKFPQFLKILELVHTLSTKRLRKKRKVNKFHFSDIDFDHYDGWKICM